MSDHTSSLGTLPTWDLNDLYAGPNDPKLHSDLSECASRSKAFTKRWKNDLTNISAEQLRHAIIEYEAIDEILSRVMSFAGLLHAGDLSDPARGQFMQNMSERATEIASSLVFFELGINNLPEEQISKLINDPALEPYGIWLDQLSRWRAHQLSEDMETFIQEKSSTGRQAWNRLFDETMAEIRFDIHGKSLTNAEALDLLSSPIQDQRRDAGIAIGKTLKNHVRVFAQITNTLAKDKAVEDKWRKYATPISARNLSNQVEDEVVDALVKAVRESYSQLSHRYYSLKAKWFGGEQLDYFDRNAPLPDTAERIIPWNEAEQTVLDAYNTFSPQLADVARPFFERPWIDAPTRPGKSPGAFAHPTVPSAHPYLLLNYQGKIRDVMTLAHELGHGVHQRLAASQGHFLSNTPLTLAETASVFGEMLTFQKLLREADATTKRSLLAGKTEDMLNTVIRQISMLTFEIKLHDERKQGELSADRICDIWMETQTESLGPALRFDEGYRYFWSYIPHFIHSPFYVYAYAFGDCLVNALYAVYQEGEDGFAQRYLEMLSSGGAKGHKELLAPFGLDASDPGFWTRGLNVIGGFIDQLESMDG
ncbi:MAG: M3 family oligoendopeptidase [Rhodospirillales bacterium]